MPYERLSRWAELHQRDVGEAIALYLAEYLPIGERTTVPPAEADPQLEREKAAYERLHAALREKYSGQYVAIYSGQMVDHDSDYGALFERIDDRFPGVFVWLTRVEDEPIGTIVFRSPRFANSVT